MSSRAVFFDLDGTLIDSVHDVHLCLNSVLAAHGRSKLSLATVTSLVGGGAKMMAHRALEMTGGIKTKNQVDDIVGSFLDLYRNNPVRLSKIFPGGTNLLDTLVGDNVLLAICTNKPRITTDPVLAYFDLKKYFSLIRCGDEVPYQKPDSRHITHMVNELGLKTEDVIMVGDSHNDICAAHGAKVRSIAVTYGYDETILSLPEVDLVAHSIAGVEDRLVEAWSA